LHLRGGAKTPSTLVDLLALMISTMGWLYRIDASLVLLSLVFFVIFSPSFAYFLNCHSIVQEKIMTAEEFAQMRSYNLAKFIHKKWLQTSNNKGDDLYVANVDDCIRAFLQVMAYHQFL
jgi:hypothetical protein